MAPSSDTALTIKSARITKGSVAVQRITLLTLSTPFQTLKYKNAQIAHIPITTGQEKPPSVSGPSDNCKISSKK